MSEPCQTLKIKFTDILNDLVSMSAEVIKKSGLHLTEVETLDVISVDHVTNSIRNLLQRVNDNVACFTKTFDTAISNYKVESSKCSPRKKLNLSLKKNGDTQNTDVDLTNSDSDGGSSSIRPISTTTQGSQNSLLSKASLDQVKLLNESIQVKDEETASDSDSEKSIQNFDVTGAVRLSQEEGKTDGFVRALDELDKVTDANKPKEEVKEMDSRAESMSFDFDDFQDELTAEMNNLANTQEELQSEDSDIEVFTTIGRSSVIPEKSKARYEITYATFKKWCDERNVRISEKVLVAYFLQRSMKLKSPSSLWAEYSMLKSTINLNDSTDISKYSKLSLFLKSKNAGYRPKKSQVFTRQDMNLFLTEAPDNEFLLMKVVMIMGVAGACGQQELCDLTLDDIEDRGSVIVVRIGNTRTRTFTIINHKEEEIYFLEICKKYASLRPERVKTRRFFLRYHNGKCINQVVGKNTIGSIPSRIATYLKKENPKAYTGHAFRRTSATMLANKRVDVLASRGWRLPEEGFHEDKVPFQGNIAYGEWEFAHINIKQEPLPGPSSASESGYY